MKSRLTYTPAFYLFAFLLLSSVAFAMPSIQYTTDSDVAKLGAVLYYSNLGEFNSPHEDIQLLQGVNPTTSTASQRFSGNASGQSGSGVSYNDAILYAEAISDGSATNGRGGLISGGMDGGVGALKILGKVISTRTGSPVRSYAEATADAYITFMVLDSNPNMTTVRTRFWIETDLLIWNNHDYNTSFDSNDRFVNFATFGGLVQDVRPTGVFDLTTANADLVMDENNNLINRVFDDPARPDQYDATNPNAISGAGSSRGGPIPEVGNTLNSNRTRLYMDDLDTLIDLVELQEPLLQDAGVNNPANNALATNSMFSLGNVTFNQGQGYCEWWFDAVVGQEYVIYVQLSANITDDGGINGKFGSSSNVENFGTLYYGIDVVPEPGTLVLIGLGALGLATAARRKLLKA